jgi:uncharacterized membrane protein
MELRVAIKQGARRALARFWGQAVAITLLSIGYQLLLAILEALLQNLTGNPPYLDILGTPLNPFDDLPNLSPLAFGLLGGGFVLSFLIGTPLDYGARRWFYLRGGGYQPDFGDVFYYFGSVSAFISSLWLAFLLGLRRLLWSVLLLSPGPICIRLGRWMALRAAPGSEMQLATGLRLAGYGLTLCGGLLLFVCLQRYTLARYARFADQNLPAREAIRRSVLASRGRRVQMALFHLSFAGWLLLAPLGVPLLFVQPYRWMSLAIYARLLLTEGPKRSQAADA